MSRAGSVAALAVLALLVALLALDLSGHRLFVVSGSSMEPAVPRGSLVLVRATSPDVLSVGDVVTFEHEGRSLTHRIDAIHATEQGRAFRTRGDANPAADLPDLVAFRGQAGRVTAVVPLAGHAVALVQAVARVTALAVGAFFALLALRAARRSSFLPARA